jgi:hypothetical protein
MAVNKYLNEKIKEFVINEVTSSGYEPNTEEFDQKVLWMLDAWRYAVKESKKSVFPSMNNMIDLGRMVERETNNYGIKKIEVGIANKKFIVDNKSLIRQCQELFESIDILTPNELYSDFLLLGPFADGNVRTAKIIYNWHLHTLLDPVDISEGGPM